MSRNFALLLGAFVALLVIALALGLARDLYSRERATLKGVIAAIDPGGQAHKSPVLRTPSVKVRLDDGRTIDAATTNAGALSVGQSVSVQELEMPWGQVWHKVAK